MIFIFFTNLMICFQKAFSLVDNLWKWYIVLMSFWWQILLSLLKLHQWSHFHSPTKLLFHCFKPIPPKKLTSDFTNLFGLSLKKSIWHLTAAHNFSIWGQLFIYGKLHFFLFLCASLMNRMKTTTSDAQAMFLLVYELY